MANYTLNNVVSSSENPNVSYCNSWLKVENNANRPLFAQASYITNFDDLSISLSANDVNIGSVHITDSNTGLAADVVPIGIGSGALRVISQDLESTEDDITIGDRVGNFASVNSTYSALNVYNTNTTPISIKYENSAQLDAFGRLRISHPETLFDSNHRYQDNNLWATLSSDGGSVAFNSSQGLVDLNVTSASNSKVIRETKKVFSYQPGKSLLVLNTFVMAQSANNFVQRVGYFGENNGIYFEFNGSVLNFVKRTYVGGSLDEIRVPRSQWNGDKLDGTGPSGLTLDITKAQIFWMDIEWLGVGTVRTGFIINGNYITCHSFHHANILNSTYITTASLPLRYEIFNTASTSSPKTLKQICSTVISEGGYQLRGMQQSINIPITSPRNLETAGTYYPVISTKLKSSPNRLDAISIISDISLLGIGNGINFAWRLVSGCQTTGGSWTSSSDSSVEYNITGTSVTSGRVLASGYFNSSNQASPTVNIPRDALFKFQFERNGLTNTPEEICLQVASESDAKSVLASLDIEEITR